VHCTYALYLITYVHVHVSDDTHVLTPHVAQSKGEQLPMCFLQVCSQDSWLVWILVVQLGS